MLALRRALFDSTWEQIIDGCKNYKAYCQAAGKEGTEYVQAPQRFIEDQSYLESFAYQIPKTKDELARDELRAKEVAALVALAGRADAVGLAKYDLESSGSFRTRIELAERAPGYSNGSYTTKCSEAGNISGSRISALVDRMRISK